MKKTDNHNSYNEKKIAKEISSLRSVRLSEKESKELWTLITSQIPTISPFSRQSFTLRSILSFGTRLVAMVLVLILGLGSGLTYASEESLPGDFLYPFKVHVSEEIQSLSRTDSESRASFATERAERRLSEVKILVTQGSFDEVKSKEAVENFEKHTKKAKEETQKLSKTNPEKALVVASNFETTLQTNSIILEELKKDTGSTKILEDVVSQVQAETVSVSEEKDKISCSHHDKKDSNKQSCSCHKCISQNEEEEENKLPKEIHQIIMEIYEAHINKESTDQLVDKYFFSVNEFCQKEDQDEIIYLVRVLSEKLIDALRVSN